MNGSSIIVLPEKIAAVTEADMPAARKVYTDAARESGTGIVLGISRFEWQQFGLGAGDYRTEVT